MSLRHPEKGSHKWTPPPHKTEIEGRIAIDPKIAVGKPVIKGTRITVEFVIDLLANGWTLETILENYPQLRREDIQACLVYAGIALKAERVYPLHYKK